MIPKMMFVLLASMAALLTAFGDQGQFTLGHQEARDVRGKEHVPHKRFLPDRVYRVLRDDEDPERIVPKDSTVDKTVLSHVNCGSRSGYKSQFISTSATLEASRKYKKLVQKKGESRSRICKFNISEVQDVCTIYDLTNKRVLDECLGNAVMARNFATKYEEVLLECSQPIKCEVVEN